MTIPKGYKIPCNIPGVSAVEHNVTNDRTCKYCEEYSMMNGFCNKHKVPKKHKDSCYDFAPFCCKPKEKCDSSSCGDNCCKNNSNKKDCGGECSTSTNFDNDDYDGLYYIGDVDD